MLQKNTRNLISSHRAPSHVQEVDETPQFAAPAKSEFIADTFQDIKGQKAKYRSEKMFLCTYLSNYITYRVDFIILDLAKNKVRPDGLLKRVYHNGNVHVLSEPSKNLRTWLVPS